MSQYAGANWIKTSLHKEMSPLGEKAADFLGDVFRGIYHLSGSSHCSLSKVDWTEKHNIEVILYSGGWSTWDFSELSRMVVLAHDRCLRLEIAPYSFHYIKLFISQRERTGDISARHPTMEDHIAIIRKEYA
jgi:hypothetical protein